MPSDYDPNRTFSMAPQTAFDWCKISIEAYFRLRDAGFLRPNPTRNHSQKYGDTVAGIIHNCYVEFSDKAKAKAESPSEGHTIKPQSGSG